MLTTGQEMGRNAVERTTARPTITPLLLSYAINPPVTAVLLLLRRWGLVAQAPVWAYLAAVWGAVVIGTLAELEFRRRPQGPGRWLRPLSHAASVTAVIYVTGWGPVLAIAYAFMAMEHIGRTGSANWRRTAAVALAGLAAGQVAIALGIARSQIDVPLVHGLAVLEGVGVVMLIRMIGAVTELKEKAEVSIRDQEDRFRSLVQNSSDLIVVIQDEIIRYASEASRALLGHAPEDLVGQPASTLVHPGDGEALRGRLLAELAGGGTARPVELRGRHADGSWRHLEVVVSDLSDRPSIAGIVVNARDVTARKLAEAALEHQALHDFLTGLPNRLLLLDRLERSLTRSVRDEAARPAVVFLDLDRFKLVNDGLGHDVGDELLARVGERLRLAVRAEDTVARFGGDEFVILCERRGDDDHVRALGDRLLACFTEPFELGTDRFHTTASIGIALADPTSTASDLLRNADAAMYRAKAQGRARVQVFDAATRDHSLERVHTESELRRALAADELRVHYQPVFDLATLQPVGVEALVRWQHPTRGLLLPGEFIDVAEDTGLIVVIGAWVLGEACRQVQHWNDARLPEHALSVSVNLSARQLSEPGLVAMVRRTLDDADIDARRLQVSLEVTETLALGQPEVAAARLRELRALGVACAIDDFGAGYSSLSYLRRFPVSTLKIDKEFVAGLGDGPQDDAIVAAMVTLGHRLGLRVVAEGVETLLQVEHLRALGCDDAQGFLLARPVPADAVRLDGPVELTAVVPA